MGSKEISTDVLVIGGGPAACFAAIKAREAGCNRVTMVCKAVAGSSGSAVYLMGNLRYWREDEIKGLIPQMLAEGLFMADEDWIESIATDLHIRMDELRKWGVKFIKVRGQELRTGKGHFAGGEKNANVWVDGGAVELLWTLRGQAIKAGVHIIDRVMISDLLTSDGKYPTGAEIVGAVGLDVRSGDFCVFKAKETILATGLAAIPRRIPPDVTGDGQAMALRAGAIMRGMDCVDFLGGGTRGNLTSGSSHLWTSFGATMVNTLQAELKEDKDYSPRSAASGADAHFDLEKALRTTRLEKKDISSPESYGGPCWDFGWRTSFKNCGPKQLQMIYKINARYMKIFEKLGYEIPEDMVPIVRAPYQSRLGGMIINRDHESNLPGLLAAGETAGKINYFQSGGVSSAMTSGAIAGTVAAMHAVKKREPVIIPGQVEKLKETVFFPMHAQGGLSPFKLRNKIVDAVCLAILEKGFLVNEGSLQRAVEGMETLKREDLPKVTARDSHELMKANELRNMLDVFPLQIRAAMLRKESRFLPREDFPFWDDKNWRKYIDLRLKEGGEVEFWTTDIPQKKEPVGAEKG